MTHNTPSRRMRVFLIVWLGQLVSLVGSGLTSFALGLWVYRHTGSVTQFALIGLFTVLPGIVLSPLAGALVDRWDRRWVMILSDSGAGLSTLMIALLFFAGRVQVWHIYLAAGVSAALRLPMAGLFGSNYPARFQEGSRPRQRHGAIGAGHLGDSRPGIGGRSGPGDPGSGCDPD